MEDSSTGDNPMVYLHGHNAMVAGVEAELDGKTTGDSIEVTLDAPYGPRRDDATQRVPIKHLVSKKRPQVGKLVVVNTDQGQRQVTVIKVGKFNVDVDTNHPYAGKTLTYSVDVVEVREATAEELAHGHVHGPGGHQH
ncbi:UNVERIFIED_CONTAM: hypothetical protein GTU68_031255 [Idotea baltica]|nr:hypothetical protein [Idotea baltica]